MAKFLVIHGPNLNLLGTRETTIYGKVTLAQINAELAHRAKKQTLVTVQSNAEHEIIACIQKAPSDKIDCMILNAGAFTHTSIAIRDALLAVKVPFYEVHLSNIFARESFRHHSYFSDIAIGVVSGLGPLGYYLALERAIEQFS